MSPRLPILVLCLAGMAACARLPRWAGGSPDPHPAEQLYWNAVAHLDSAGRPASLDSAMYYLDRYLVSSHRHAHAREAQVLRRLVEDAQQLKKVEELLQQARADGERRSDEPRRSDESVREVQRLRDELAKANAELERIRKRLANPKEPQP